MPRPRKTGLDYFPFDCDFFDDEKIVALAGEFGIKGEIAAVKLLCAIYRNGYFIEWNDMLKYKMLHRMPGISAELFEQILNRLVRWGFFDASLFDSVKVLTSVGIQRRYFNIVKRCKKDADYPYLLINVTETRVNVTETRVNVAESTQSKVKKIKKSPNGDKKNAVVAVPEDYDKLLEDFFAENRRGSLEQFCMTNRIDLSALRSLVEEIINDWRVVAQPPHKSREDAFTHIANTVRIKIKKNHEANRSGPGLNERRQGISSLIAKKINGNGNRNSKEDPLPF